MLHYNFVVRVLIIALQHCSVKTHLKIILEVLSLTFADRLRLLRTEHGLTQKDVFSAIGVAPIVYQRYEYGRSPSFENLIALADFFDVSLDYLVGRSDVPERR